MNQKNILITGYEPFGGDAVNPSLDLAKTLSGTVYKDFVFQYAKIPVNRQKCVPTMIEAIQCYQPEIVICTGLAYGRAAISIERTAVNIADFPFPDNEGYIALNESIDPTGDTAYFSTLPIRAIMKNIQQAGIPAYVSNSAGTYCCNMLMYGTLNYIKKNNLDIRAGMLHVPYTPDMAITKGSDMPSMSLNNMIQAIKLAAITAIETNEDISLICGAAQ
ncbi:MAG: pyroglutamyl-peptidase I [Clostridia bacterium]|nr:pyroglutamyl-peptidase I [Lachnospiraceae bacterium]NCC00406.1 pyroglutamyl-peptidase I [Clostridia bacterium]NCD02605.1 pyroglutamyl-peptidase I [Clostridia bacterium]